MPNISLASKNKKFVVHICSILAFVLFFWVHPAAAIVLNLTSDGTLQGPHESLSSNNTVTFKSGSSNSFTHFIYGGHSINGSGGNASSGNSLVIDAPGVTFGSTPNHSIDPILADTIFSALGGYVIDDDSGAGYTVENNSLRINAGTASGLAIGGVFFSSYTGSRSGPALVRNNTLTLTGSTIVESESFAGVAYLFNNDNVTTVSGNVLNVSGNASIITDQSTTGPFIGGGFSYQLDGTGNSIVTGNTVNLSENGNLFGSVIGGGAIVQNGSGRAIVSNNTVNIYGGTIDTDSGYVAGGYAGTDTPGLSLAEQNTVNLSGGAVTGNIAGGYAGNAGYATGNMVNISGGTVQGDVAGGAIENGGYATGNWVNISGGTVQGNVYGGFANNINGYATGNSVMISGTPNLTNATLYGNDNPQGGGAWQTDGNTLIVNGFQGTVQGVGNFQNYSFYLPASITTGQTMLTVTNTPDITDTTVKIAGLAGGGTLLAPGDTITLIQSATVTGTPLNSSASSIGGVSLLYDFDLAITGNGLDATVTSVQDNPQTKALSEGRAAGLAFVGQGADMLAGQGMSSALAATGGVTGASGLAGFGAMNGGSNRYDTGSHVDVDGFSLMTGLGWRNQMPSGSLLLGAFFEAGWGNYNSHNSFNSVASVNGGGDTSYYGGGVLGRYDLAQGILAGLYTEASLRAGYASSDFSSNDFGPTGGTNASYDSGAIYYGAHAGLGYIWRLNDVASLDFSTKYLWTHQNSDSVTILGDSVNFRASDSQRWRSGARFNYAVSSNSGVQFTPYLGAAWDYEFDGKARGSVNGTSIDSPSLKGGTGVGELGMSFKPAADSGFSADLGVQGYVGQREGVTGSFQMKYAF